MPISPVSIFPSPAAATLENGTSVGITVGAEAATGATETCCAAPRKEKMDTTSKIARTKRGIFMTVSWSGWALKADRGQAAGTLRYRFAGQPLVYLTKSTL